MEAYERCRGGGARKFLKNEYDYNNIYFYNYTILIIRIASKIKIYTFGKKFNFG